MLESGNRAFSGRRPENAWRQTLPSAVAAVKSLKENIGMEDEKLPIDPLAKVNRFLKGAK